MIYNDKINYKYEKNPSSNTLVIFLHGLTMSIDLDRSSKPIKLYNTIKLLFDSFIIEPQRSLSLVKINSPKALIPHERIRIYFVLFNLCPCVQGHIFLYLLPHYNLYLF